MSYRLFMQRGVLLFSVATALVGFAAASGCSGLLGVEEFVPNGAEGDAGVPKEASPDATATVTIDGSIHPQCGEIPTEPPAVDAGPGGPGDDGGAVCPTSATITAADIDAQFQWKAPVPPQNVCTQQNIDALKAKLKASPSGVTYVDMKAALGATCTACVFSPLSGPNWQIVAEATGGGILNSSGSCFAQRVGGACGPSYGAVCGRARYRFETCLDLACTQADCGSEAGALQRCNTKAEKGACKAVVDAYLAACNDEVDLVTHCGNIFQAIATSCSGGPNHTIDTKP